MSAYQTRRATTDDVSQLVELWRSAHLPAEKLEKEFTDFQLAQTPEGVIIAAIGLQISGSHGLLHAEAFSDFGLTDELRPALWQRLQVVAKNHGLIRIWNRESAPWWRKDAGFAAPTPEALEKLPASFGSKEEVWTVLQLRDEIADPEQLEKEMRVFQEGERRRTADMIRHGKMLQGAALLIAGGIFVWVLIQVIKHGRN